MSEGVTVDVGHLSSGLRCNYTSQINMSRFHTEDCAAIVRLKVTVKKYNGFN